MLPSPRTSDTNGAGHHGDGGMDLRTAVTEALLPTPSVADSTGGHERRGGERGEELLLKGVARAVAEGTLLPTPQARDAKGYGPADLERNDPNLSALPLLLPTPRATDGTNGTKGGPNQRGSSGDLMLPSAVNLLPTPTAQDSKSSGSAGYTTGHDGTTLTDATVRQPAKWGEYEPAIRRWEAITRPAPEPTKLGAKGNPKLSDEFDEWFMGYPAGWITDVPGVTWNETLKACGNGVLPQQGSAAVRWLVRMGRVAA